MDLKITPTLKSPILWYTSLAVIWLLCLLSLVNQTYNPFIYFRF